MKSLFQSVFDNPKRHGSINIGAGKGAIEMHLKIKVYLDLRIKVKKDWSRSPRSLEELGYE